jgi:hypothetical protein
MAKGTQARTEEQETVAKFPPGIFVSGRLVRRTRRLIGEKQNTLITYSLLTEEGVVEVKQWNPSSGTQPLALNENYVLRVVVRVRDNRVEFRFPESDFDF